VITKTKLEIEIKIRVADVKAFKLKIIKNGFACIKPRYFENNIVLDTPNFQLKQQNYLLRLRSESGKNILTLKRPVLASKNEKYKIREELELEVEDFSKAHSLFTFLGYQIVFRYQKFREVFYNKDLYIMIDETPIGIFIELEGEPSCIDKFAKSMNIPKTNYITANYLTLFRQLHSDGDMIFHD
jgi:adenylate cyclase class 2